MKVHVVVLDDRNSGVNVLGVFSDREDAVACGREATEEDFERWEFDWTDAHVFSGGWSWGESNAVYITEHDIE